MLETHPWPGNIRELRNAIERAVLLSDGDELAMDHFQFICNTKDAAKKDGDFRLPPGGIVFQDLERELMVQALERARGNQTRAAELLGMTRDQIRYRIAKFKLNESEKVGQLEG
jgi:two-component system, NtrC family, response regulator AtoC